MKFTVKRSEWLRGRGGDHSYLLSVDGKRCCLGFFGVAAGLDDHQMLGVQTPMAAGGGPEIWPGLVDDEDLATPTGEGAMCVNDKQMITDAHREGRLVRLFASIGHEVEFVE